MFKVTSKKDKKRMSIVAGITALSLLAIIEPSSANPAAKWTAGSVPADAVESGQFNGKPINVCKMPMPNKEVHSGKVWNGTCYVGFGGKELNLPVAQAEVLSLPGAAWAPAAGAPPQHAVLVGESGGSPMHVCRAEVASGQVHPGKAWKGNCYVGFGGKELKVAQYEFLTADPAAAVAAAAPTDPAAVAAAEAAKAAADSAAAEKLAKAQAEFDQADGAFKAAQKEMTEAQKARNAAKIRELGPKMAGLARNAQMAQKNLMEVKKSIKK